MSVQPRIVECMFEDFDDAGVVDAIGSSTRAENAACAQRLAAIAELFYRRAAADRATGRELWWLDTWDAVAAEVSAAQCIMPGAASTQLGYAVALRDRLPKVAEVFRAGRVSHRLVKAVLVRTELVEDPAALTGLDAKLAERIVAWGPLSDKRMTDRIDYWVEEFDPGAIRRTTLVAESREVRIEPTPIAGMSSLSGLLYATDGAALDRRLTQLANTVCADDPRLIAQRRADALGALAAGQDRLGCLCGKPDCPAATAERPSSNVVVHVVTDAAVMNTPAPARPGLVLGGGIVPPSLVAELARSAKLRPLAHPGDAPPEPRYRPSADLEWFVRCRDLTCRFPGCDRPADLCDIDHTVAFDAGGFTHASNLKCLCRKHHLLKTFYDGPAGWRDRQLADGTVVWTSPSGHTYTTAPGSNLLIPSLTLPTGDLPPPPISKNSCTNRGVMMPTRRRTRAEDRARRRQSERALNDAHVAERNTPPPF